MTPHSASLFAEPDRGRGNARRSYRISGLEGVLLVCSDDKRSGPNENWRPIIAPRVSNRPSESHPWPVSLMSDRQLKPACSLNEMLSVATNILVFVKSDRCPVNGGSLGVVFVVQDIAQTRHRETCVPIVGSKLRNSAASLEQFDRRLLPVEKTIAMTARYAHLVPIHLKSAVNEIGVVA